VTLTARVSSPIGSPTGTLTFSDGSTTLGTAALKGGSATLSTSTLALGAHTITMAYSGDGNFAAATSVAITENIQDFSVAFAGSAQTVVHGGTVSYQLTLGSLGGATMPAAIAFAVAGAPAGSAISFSPQMLSAGSGSTAVTLSIRTPDYPTPPTALNRQGKSSETTLALLIVGGLLIPFRRRFGSTRRWLGCVLLAGASLAMLGAIAGCGSGWNSGAYAIKVSAASGPLSHTADTLLTVK